jgi:hypothetical protein
VANQLHQQRRWRLAKEAAARNSHEEINQEENHGKSETEEESGEEDGEAQNEAQGQALTFICPVE